MSFDKPLPPAVFGEEPEYVAIRKDIADIRSPVTPVALAQIHQTFPGDWTYITIAEAIERINRDGVTITPTPTPAQQLAEVKAKLTALRCAVAFAVDQISTSATLLSAAAAE